MAAEHCGIASVHTGHCISERVLTRQTSQDEIVASLAGTLISSRHDVLEDEHSSCRGRTLCSVHAAGSTPTRLTCGSGPSSHIRSSNNNNIDCQYGMGVSGTNRKYCTQCFNVVSSLPGREYTTHDWRIPCFERPRSRGSSPAPNRFEGTVCLRARLASLRAVRL